MYSTHILVLIQRFRIIIIILILNCSPISNTIYYSINIRNQWAYNDTHNNNCNTHAKIRKVYRFTKSR